MEDAVSDRLGRQAGDEFSGDLATGDVPDGRAGHGDQSVAATGDKRAQARVPDLEAAELERLAILQPGTRLEQGSVYVDLNALDRGPFQALASQQAGAGDRYVAKRDTDHELWNRLVGERETQIERPTGGD